MSAEELAGLVCETLLKAGITTTLSGGGCVAIWSEGKYVSHDLDFIEEGRFRGASSKPRWQNSDSSNSIATSFTRTQNSSSNSRPGR
jgi:hypothetical protein